MSNNTKETEDQDSKQINYYWQLFVSLFSEDDHIHAQLKKEKQVFANSVWSVSQMF